MPSDYFQNLFNLPKNNNNCNITQLHPYTPPPGDIIELSSVDSTNNYALTLLRQQNLTERQITALHGTMVFAHEQWAGKGQRGKKWITQPGANLLVSVIIKPPHYLTLHRQFMLSALVALAARKLVAAYTDSDITIKWPNDIYFKDRKAGGILIENVIMGNDWKWAVMGVGININQTAFDATLPNAVSLRQITGKNFDCMQLAIHLRRYVLEMMMQYLPKEKYIQAPIETAYNLLLTDYNQQLYKKNEVVKLKKGSRVFEATIQCVTPAGQLVVQHGIEERFSFGEVSWVL